LSISVWIGNPKYLVCVEFHSCNDKDRVCDSIE
jgi:hypothetical protein